MGKLEQFLEWFHDGRESEYDKILKVFQTTRRFLQAVIKYGEKDQIDIGYIPNKEWRNDDDLFDFLAENGFLDNVDYNSLEDDSLKNYYLRWMMNKDTNSTLNYICNNILTDVEIRDDGYWLRLRDRDELAEFFKSSSRRSDYDIQEIAKSVLGDNGLDYEYFYNTTYDVYSDVIEELNEKNIQHLANYILKNIGNNDLNISDYNSDFFEELQEIQARDGIFQITQDNVMSLIKDKEAMEELMQKDLSDLEGELYSIHSNAYNSVYENTIYTQVMDGLEEYFSSPIDEVAKQVGEKTRYTPYIKIRDFYSNVLAFIENNLGMGYSDSILEYFGSYTGMMGQLFQEEVYEPIDFRVDDYPDHREVDQAINDYFGDYI
jgi:hypothetical protein